MSLINDALKRARESQQQQPPGPPLRPVERPHGRGGNLWLTVAFAVVLAAAVVLLWQWVQQGRKPAGEIAANAPPSTPAPSKPTLPPSSPKRVETAAVPAPVAPKATELAPPPPLASAAPKPRPPVSTGQPASTAVAAAAPPAIEAPPKPALKLNGILFHPARPSAIINGKLVFVGDRAGEFRVTAINRASVTLVGGGTTNVLSLQ
jgi:hypothetical protein